MKEIGSAESPTLVRTQGYHRSVETQFSKIIGMKLSCQKDQPNDFFSGEQQGKRLACVEKVRQNTGNCYSGIPLTRTVNLDEKQNSVTNFFKVRVWGEAYPPAKSLSGHLPDIPPSPLVNREAQRKGHDKHRAVEG